VLKHGDINPLAVWGLRALDHLPPHFVPIHFGSAVAEKQISDWIWENLDGRFYIGDRYYVSEDGKIELNKCVAFEVPGEASLFALMLDQINTYRW
jgi:hypothetical protein